MSRPKVNKIETLAETKFLKLYTAEYTNKKGEERNWSIASRKDINTINNKFFKEKEDNIDAVIILPIHIEQNKIVIIKQFRVPINDYIYELPAGLVDNGEQFEAAVKRELKEETGLELINIDYDRSKTKTYLSPGMTDESAAFITCTCRGNISNEFLEADEDIEVMLLSKEEAKELIASNNNIDIKALISLQNYIQS